MKIQGKIQPNDDGISLDILDKKGNILVRGNKYTESDIKNKMTIYTHLHNMITVGLTFNSSSDYWNVNHLNQEIFYKANYIKI